MAYTEHDVDEVARIYRAVISSIMDSDSTVEMTVGEMHKEAARAVLNWLVISGRLVGGGS